MFCPFSPVPFSVTQVLLPRVRVGSGVVQEEGAVLREAYSIWGNNCCNPCGFATAESIGGAGGVCDQTLQLGQVLLSCALMSNSARSRSSLESWREGNRSLK